MNILKKNKKLILIIVMIFIIVTVFMFGSMKKYVFDDIDSGEYKKAQLANGRYYYLKTKMVSLSNIEHARVNDMYQKVYDDKFFRREDIHESWRDLQATTYDVLQGYKQNDQR